ncbi:hypothetical protein [Nostoc sp. UHCC 0252]|nr:hypothetical protein [Nostoc sp. UHCC 0252]MEA5600696.1 hypothetical protein [Nostoc sp. UHCC 0252]
MVIENDCAFGWYQERSLLSRVIYQARSFWSAIAHRCETLLHYK